MNWPDMVIALRGSKGAYYRDSPINELLNAEMQRRRDAEKFRDIQRGKLCVPPRPPRRCVEKVFRGRVSGGNSPRGAGWGRRRAWARRGRRNWGGGSPAARKCPA